MFYFTCNEFKIYESVSFWNKLQEKNMNCINMKKTKWIDEYSKYGLLVYLACNNCHRPWKTHRSTPKNTHGVYCAIVLDTVCKPFLNSSFLEVLIIKHFTVDIWIN